MSEKALKTYLQNYEKYMTTPFRDYLTKEQKTCRQIIRESVSARMLSKTKANHLIFIG